MKLPIYQIDAFAEKPFEGNPAAVVPLDAWLPEETMQAIAQENNLAETAFFVPANGAFHIRWFTPKKEVELCGHATLASAFVLFELSGHDGDTVVFDSWSGPLSVTRSGGSLTLDFPARAPQSCEIPDDLAKGLGRTPSTCYRSDDFMAVFEDEASVAGIDPDHGHLERLDLRGVIVTAPASASPDVDFVARFFAPKAGIPEDPVTGSAYTQLAPYWSERLGKTVLGAKQISPRGGKLTCELAGERVLISGRAIKYLEGKIEIDT